MVMVRARDRNGKFIGNKYTKIRGVWYRSMCNDCNKLLQGYKSKLCVDCKMKYHIHIVIAGKPINNYHHIHHWVKKQLGKPCKCENCGLVDNNSRRFHWANISGDYLKDTSDWLRLCASCHKTYDTGRLGVK